MTESEVIQHAGPPLASTPLYEPRYKRPNTIGKTFWYAIGGTTRDERSGLGWYVGVRFETEASVIRVDVVHITDPRQ